MTQAYSSGDWKAKDGEEDEFVAAWTEFVRWMQKTPGSGTARLTQNLSEPGRFMSFADWESADAMRQWKSSPEFKEKMGAVQAHVAAFTPTEWELVTKV